MMCLGHRLEAIVRRMTRSASAVSNSMLQQVYVQWRRQACGTGARPPEFDASFFSGLTQPS